MDHRGSSASLVREPTPTTSQWTECQRISGLPPVRVYPHRERAAYRHSAPLEVRTVSSRSKVCRSFALRLLPLPQSSARRPADEFHGGVYEYFRNTVMDANDWFANEAGNPRAEEHHSSFGGYLGGPIWRKKTFFFASYEGARLRLPQTSAIQVP